jgi:hypothetical protein
MDILSAGFLVLFYAPYNAELIGEENKRRVVNEREIVDGENSRESFVKYIVDNWLELGNKESCR